MWKPAEREHSPEKWKGEHITHRGDTTYRTINNYSQDPFVDTAENIGEFKEKDRPYRRVEGEFLAKFSPDKMRG